MKFSNQYNEIFFNNIIKHDLTMYEWKVITTFVTDSEEFNISLKEIERRTEIAQPNISKSLKGLVYQGILIKDEKKKYILNDALLDKEYSPSVTSSSDTRRQDDSAEPKNSGNFKRQAEIKEEKMAVIDENIKKMQKETAAKKKRKYPGWDTYFSNFAQAEISVKIEEHDGGAIIRWCSGNPNTGRTSIAPQEVAEEVCREILKIEDPNEMIKYMYSPYQDDFIRKYNLKRAE